MSAERRLSRPDWREKTNSCLKMNVQLYFPIDALWPDFNSWGSSCVNVNIIDGLNRCFFRLILNSSKIFYRTFEQTKKTMTRSMFVQKERKKPVTQMSCCKCCLLFQPFCFSGLLYANIQIILSVQDHNFGKLLISIVTFKSINWLPQSHTCAFVRVCF